MIITKLTTEDKIGLKQLLYKFYIEDIKRFSKKVQHREEYKDDRETIDKTADEYLKEDKSKLISYVAKENNKLIGYIRGEIKDKPHKKNYYKEGYVQDWFVDPVYQGRKIGKKLFDRLAEDFKNLGCTHILLDTLAENKKAQGIYHKMGFEDKALILIKDLPS